MKMANESSESTTKTKFHCLYLNHPSLRGTFGKLVLSSISVIPPYAWTISTACTKTGEGELTKNTRQHRGGFILHVKIGDSTLGQPMQVLEENESGLGKDRQLCQGTWVTTTEAFGIVENSCTAGWWGKTTSQPGWGEDSCSQVIDSPSSRRIIFPQVSSHP